MFIENKYTRCYFSIVARAKTRVFDISEYSEKHHIIPKSLGGSDNIDNLVRLSAKEHFICHMLLTRMTFGEHRVKMVYAAWRLAVPGRTDQKRYKLSAKSYETIKKQRSDYLKSRVGPLNKNYGRRTGRTSADFTPEWRAKLSEARLGKSSWNKGITHSDETKELLSTLARNRTKKECPHCSKIVVPANYARWHGDNCKKAR